MGRSGLGKFLHPVAGTGEVAPVGHVLRQHYRRFASRQRCRIQGETLIYGFGLLLTSESGESVGLVKAYVGEFVGFEASRMAYALGHIKKIGMPSGLVHRRRHAQKFVYVDILSDSETFLVGVRRQFGAAGLFIGRGQFEKSFREPS